MNRLHPDDIAAIARPVEHCEPIADYARYLELRDWFSQAYPDAPCRIRARAAQLFADVCGVR